MMVSPFLLAAAGLIYLIDPEMRSVFLAGTCGIGRDHPAVPERVSLDEGAVWPFREVAGGYRGRVR